MSILLDAVTRANQQDLDNRLDPVLTPRAQYKELSAKGPRDLLILLSVLILGLLAVIAWLASDYLMASENKLESSESEITPTLKQGNNANASLDRQDFTGMDETFASDKASKGIRLAGKVALPLAKTLPKPEPLVIQVAPAASTLVATAKPKAASPRDSGYQLESVSEPIILGANANQKGQDMLAALKFQVNEAAEDLGMENTANTSKHYQSDNKMYAAFKDALKAVEVKNSLAAPMTEPGLDPIPTAKSDTIPKYGQLPAGLQLQVPEFNIKAHVYSTDPDNRWLNVDGVELQEGDSIGGKLDIVEIRPRDVVLSIQGTKFKVPAI
ncbi:general secretion pathway protein GspB [Shewanella violacea]|uniref:General secretion pathway protein B n=1 Tax=Shewanella violacea (strain JCM 10179 / CIP 106290 / LMG 19151 / DSS12) TaxID=637905 RepID=D4ZGR4_SHEVD|nr:general secretion pathway protein GspB [Shewanella violacea]BAJ00863.1 general secretion pathway protein B [Shewanella violacea DSS12]